MLHIAATSQIRLDTPGRVYYRQKLAAGKTPMEAIRCLKGRISDTIYRQLATDAHTAQNTATTCLGTGPGEHCGATLQSSAVDLPPHIDTSDQPLPGPATATLRPSTLSRKTMTGKALEPAG
jgi:transposase